MCNGIERCPVFLVADEIGLVGAWGRNSGCLLDTLWVYSLRARRTQTPLSGNRYIDTPHKTLTAHRTVAQGAFGFIDTAWYRANGHSSEVYVKRPIHYPLMDPPSLLQEACIQKVVGEQLARYGFPESVPRVLDVFQLHSGAVCFSMEQAEGVLTLDRYLSHLPAEMDLTPVLMGCLLPVVGMVACMNDIGVNHRDLKPTNFLLRVLPTAVPCRMTLGGRTVEWMSPYHLILIDFGFACVGSPPTGRAHLSLGSIYPTSDPCPKDGRDLFLFLCLLYVDYHARMSVELRMAMESWLRVDGSDLCGFMRQRGEGAKEWIYFMTGSETIRQLRCHPLQVLDGLLALP